MNLLQRCHRDLLLLAWWSLIHWQFNSEIVRTSEVICFWYDWILYFLQRRKRCIEETNIRKDGRSTQTKVSFIVHWSNSLVLAYHLLITHSFNHLLEQEVKDKVLWVLWYYFQSGDIETEFYITEVESWNWNSEATDRSIEVSVLKSWCDVGCKWLEISIQCVIFGRVFTENNLIWKCKKVLCRCSNFLHSVSVFSQEKVQLNKSVEEKDKDIEEKNKTVQQVSHFYFVKMI